MQAPLLSDFEEHIETQGEEKCIFKRKGSKKQKIESFILARATRASTYHFFLVDTSLFNFMDTSVL